MCLTIDPAQKFTPDDVRLYAKKHGTIAAIDWLYLIPPDKFDGDWQKMYDELESSFYWGSEHGVQQDKV